MNRSDFLKRASLSGTGIKPDYILNQCESACFRAWLECDHKA